MQIFTTHNALCVPTNAQSLECEVVDTDITLYLNAPSPKVDRFIHNIFQQPATRLTLVVYDSTMSLDTLEFECETEEDVIDCYETMDWMYSEMEDKDDNETSADS